MTIYKLTYSCGHRAFTSDAGAWVGQERECPTCSQIPGELDPYRNVTSITMEKEETRNICPTCGQVSASTATCTNCGILDNFSRTR